MANCAIILGKSGTGKSTSIKGLDPKSTLVLNVLNKKLPFRGSTSVYNSENKNLFRVDKYSDIINMLENVDKSAPHIKNIIIDDAIYVMRKEFFTRAKENGFGKFTDLAMHFQQIISTCEKMKDDINIFLLLHSEDIQSDKITTGFKVSTVGKLLEDQYNPIEVVPMVLYSDIKYNDKGIPEYGFYTHRVMVGTIEIPAKSPDGMFESNFIPNDLGFVVDKINEYYA